MASEIKVNKITGKGATGGVDAPLQFDGNILTTATITDATITDATIANMTNCTFPTGHVIQTIVDTDTGTIHGTTTQTAWTTDIPGLSCVITSKQINSNFLITAYSGMAMDSGDSGRLQVDIKRIITGGATTAGIVAAVTNGSDNYGWIHQRQGSWGTVNATFEDVLSLSAGTTITYSLVFRSGGGGQIYWNHSGSFASLMVQEMAG